MPFKNVTATTKDGTIHRWIDGNWDKKITVPAATHMRLLARINRIREETNL